MKEINKAAINSWLRDKKIIRVSSSDNLTLSEEKDLAKEVGSIRARKNGICILIIETK